MNKTRICVLGRQSEQLDEGMTNIAYHISKNLEESFPNLKLFNVENAFSVGFWKKILHYKPDIVHYIPGPTTKGLVLLKIIQLITKSKTVVSATRPVLPKYFKLFSNFLKPDLVFVQSSKSKNFFKNINYKTVFLSNGVDTERFTPPDTATKKVLRKKYGFNEDDFIVLHIGPIKKARNQRALISIPNIKILLIVSLTNKSEPEEYNELKKENVVIWKSYFPNIEEIYRIVDVYVFPGIEDLNSIEIPLSVLEAMSCNLPVVTTRYGGLESIFEEGDGLFFVNSSNELEKVIMSIKNNSLVIKTREKALNYSWKNIVTKLTQFYHELIPEIKN